MHGTRHNLTEITCKLSNPEQDPGVEDIDHVMRPRIQVRAIEEERIEVRWVCAESTLHTGYRNRRVC